MKKKYVATIIICIIVTLILSVLLLQDFSCSKYKYDEKDFIGKRSDEIEAEFGKFDHRYMMPDDDGLYRNTRCGYMLEEAKVGYLGTEDEVLIYIVFDENAIAVRCHYGPIPGG